jgi:branched-chain amino acid transport system ATP-binding protein
MSDTSPLLEVSHLSKRFSGVVAVSDVSFTIPHGSLCGLIGPNGSGKTTVFNMISGIYRPNTGTIMFHERAIGGQPAYKVARTGIARTFQNLRLFKSMSVLENVLVGMGGFPHASNRTYPWDPYLRPITQSRMQQRMQAEALDLLDKFNLADVADLPANTLPYGKQRRTEIARALATRPTLLMLDEPTAGLNTTETRELDVLLQQLVADGLTILLIEHDMRLVMGICSQVTVLDHGIVIAHGSPESVQMDEQVMTAYLGKDDE